MFKNDYQGGNFFEVFNPSIKDPLGNCKLGGISGIQKVYDRDVKSSIYHLQGITTVTKISMPRESRQGLSLIQRCLVVQLEVKLGQEFTMEIGISDLNQNKRNLSFSTSHKEISVQPLSARIPIKCINRGQWTNFAIDLAAFVTDIWKSQTFKSIDTITVCANCKLRKIFTLKNVPTIESGLMQDAQQLSNSQIDFPIGVDSKLQILTFNDVKPNENPDYSRMNSSESLSSFNDSLGKSTSSNKQNRIAFGTKVYSNKGVNNPKSKQHTGDQLFTKRDVNTAGMRTDRRNSESDSISYAQSVNQDNLENSSSSLLSSSANNKTNKTKLTNSAGLNNRTKSANVLNNNTNKSNITNNNNNENLNISNGLKTSNSSLNDSKKDDLPGKKLPHPPPPSTKPTAKPNLTARKLRLSAKPVPANTKSNSEKEKSKKSSDISNNYTSSIENISNSQNGVNISNKINNNENSINHNSSEQIHQQKSSNQLNESISDIIQALKLNEKPPAHSSTATNNNEKNVYSFSSKPKAVVEHYRKLQNHSKAYDFRKYTSNSPAKSNNNKDKENGNHDMNSESIAKPEDLFNIPVINATSLAVNASTNPKTSNEVIKKSNENLIKNLQNSPRLKANLSPNNNKYDVQSMDSFEARMLLDMKAEMDGVGSNNKTIEQTKLSNKNKINDMPFTNSPINYDSNNPNNYNDDNSSGKYTFEITNSYDTDSNTSISRKLLKKESKSSNTRNYQDEIVSLMSNHPRNSTTMRDTSWKVNGEKAKNGAITEEANYEDSQATELSYNSDEDEIALLYDEALNAYYDPSTKKYYEINK